MNDIEVSRPLEAIRAATDRMLATVDLGLDYGPDDWPADFVTAELDLVVADLPRRLAPGTALHIVTTDDLGEWRVGAQGDDVTVVEASGGQLLAWLIGRPSRIADPPEVGPWQ